MKDLRLLTLYKQHYLDRYDRPMKSKITCIGYYDGLDLEEIDNSKFVDKTCPEDMASITNLWYATGEKVAELPGGYSNQNIGLIRCVEMEGQEEYTRRYWQAEKTLPFFSVAFLKLKDCEQYITIGWEIEKRIFENEIVNTEKTSIVLSYTTLDNSDMVLLLKGNDIATMEKTLHEIENRGDITYLHAILGIEEDYLQCCAGSNKIAETWKGTKCFVDQEIKRIEMHLATNGEKHVRTKIKSELERWNQGVWKIKGFENVTYSYVMGHGNINLTLRETDVQSLLILLLPGGFSTHQNHAYEDGVYNIETSIFIEESPLSEKTDTADSQGVGTVTEANWCKRMIVKYSQSINDVFVRSDEGLYACYQALIQTLNSLDQYERFALSRDIFDIVLPSFRMFDDKIDKATEKMKAGEGSGILESLKDTMRRYLECVNSVIYHTIHTEQVYLMVPGYSGTSFSIPIKLKLFYTWYSYKITDLLNDADKKHSYIIVPVIETRPKTSMIGVELESDGKVIHVCLSQRTLFQPRYLMIILAHEIGHYVGCDIRLREMRLDCILKTMAYFITEAIFPEEYVDDSLSLCHFGLYARLRESITDHLPNDIGEIFQRKKAELTAGRYYVRDVEGPLMQWCSDLLMEEGLGKEIYDKIHTIPAEILSDVEQDEENYVKNMKYISEIQKRFERNRRRLSSTGTCKKIVAELITIYKEVFSDIVAITVLDCDRDEYRKAFYISEGNNIFSNEGVSPVEQEIRQDIMDLVMFLDAEPEGVLQEDMGLLSEAGYDEDNTLYANLPRYVWLIEQLKEYAEECHKKIQERLSDQKRAAIVRDVRQIYRLLGDSDSEYASVYSKISNCVAEYRKMVRQYS